MSKKPHCPAYYEDAKKKVVILYYEGLAVKEIVRRLKVSNQFVHTAIFIEKNGKSVSKYVPPDLPSISMAKKIAKIQALEHKLFNVLLPEIQVAEKKNVYSPRIVGEYIMLSVRYAFAHLE